MFNIFCYILLTLNSKVDMLSTISNMWLLLVQKDDTLKFQATQKFHGSWYYYMDLFITWNAILPKKNIKKLTSMYNLTYIDKKNSHILSFTKL